MAKTSTTALATAAVVAAATAAAKAPAAPPKDTTTYLVTHVPIRHKGHMHPVDSDIELTDAEAADLAGLVMRKDTAPPGAAAAGADGAESTSSDAPTGDGVSGE